MSNCKTLALTVLLLSMLFNAQAQTALPKTFTVYAFIPWNASNSHVRDNIFNYNIRPIKIIYENNYFTNGEIDLKKIQKIAEQAAAEPHIPISFDMEFGKRFHPETVIPKAEAILKAYIAANPKALVSMYATIPQVTYAWKNHKQIYDKLNERYQSLVQYIDFLSPSLYNHDGRDFEAWSKSVKYNFEIAKKYGAGKPIIPYISPVYKLADYKQIKNGNLVEELNEKEMQQRLQLLYDLGASGCIIWVSSQDRNRFGQIPYFSADENWGKAVVEFVKTHS